MAETKKVLGQSSPSPGVLTDLYTVPVSTQTVISTISICNPGPVGATFSVSIAVGGTTDNPMQYLYSGIPVPANDTFASTIGITMNDGDIMRCYTETAQIAFQVFGIEIT